MYQLDAAERLKSIKMWSKLEDVPAEDMSEIRK
jgi:hypothetical protein